MRLLYFFFLINLAVESFELGPSISETSEDNYVMRTLTNSAIIHSSEDPTRIVAISPEEIAVQLLSQTVPRTFYFLVSYWKFYFLFNLLKACL